VASDQLNASKCKIMHIGYSPCTVYNLHDDGGNSIAIEQTVKETDLGVHIIGNLKSSTQCVRSAAKARLVMGMVRMNFRFSAHIQNVYPTSDGVLRPGMVTPREEKYSV